MTKSELLDRLAVLLGGRVAEEIVFGEISTGAHNDLQRATDIAASMVKEYGMSDALGNVAYDRERSAFLQPGIPMVQSRDYSEKTANVVDSAVRTLVDHALERAIGILKINRALLDRTAEELLKTETMNPPQIEALKREIISKPALPAETATAATA